MDLKTFENKTIEDLTFKRTCFKGVSTSDVAKFFQGVTLPSSFQQALEQKEDYYVLAKKGDMEDLRVITVSGDPYDISQVYCYDVVPYFPSDVPYTMTMSMYRLNWTLSQDPDLLEEVFVDNSNLPVPFTNRSPEDNRTLLGLLFDRKHSRDPILVLNEGAVRSCVITDIKLLEEFPVAGNITFLSEKCDYSFTLSLAGYNVNWYAYCEDFSSF